MATDKRDTCKSTVNCYRCNTVVMVLENGSLKKKGTISICADCVAIENLANVGKNKQSYSEDSLFGSDAVNDLMNLFGMKK